MYRWELLGGAPLHQPRPGAVETSLILLLSHCSPQLISPHAGRWVAEREGGGVGVCKAVYR